MARQTNTRLTTGRPAQRRAEAGFTVTEMVVAIVVVAVITAFAVVRVTVARDQMRLTETARQFASYAEKARLDSIRRHGDGVIGLPARVVVNANSYEVFLDENYDGAPTSRVFDLPAGVTVSQVDITDASNTVHENQPLPVTVSFDWHGRSASGYRIYFKNTRAHEALVGVTRAGEVSLDRKPITLLAGNYDSMVAANDAGSLGSVAAGTGGTTTGGTTTTGTTTGVTTTDATTTGTTTGGTTTGGTTTGGTTTGGTTTGGTTTGGTTTGTTTGGTTTGTTTGGTTTGTTTGGTTTGGTTTGGTTTGNSNNGNTTTTTTQCTMSLSPATTPKTALSLHNGGITPESTTVTVTFTNPTATAGFSVSPVSQLKIEVSGNTIKITAIANSKTVNNRGNFTVRVTPSTGCGAYKDINVSVAK